MDMHGWWDAAAAIVTAVGLKILGAIVLYFIGRKLISVPSACCRDF
jgi:hypothetical protein